MSQQLPFEAPRMKQVRRMMAADWLQRVNSDAVSDEELKEWLEWYSQNEDNRRAFDHVDLFFRALRTASPAAKDTLRKLAADKAAKAVMRESWVNRKRLWSVAAAVALGISATLAGWQWINKDFASARSYQTSRGEHRKVKLPDGSSALIGAQSMLEVAFDDKRRLLTVISGETYFQVKRDPLRPFVVQAGPAQVTALGTAFDVHRSGDRVTVAVIDGVVEVKRAAPGSLSSPAPRRLRVMAGERAVVTTGSQTSSPELKVMPVDPATTIAWQAGQLSFSGEPLSAVIESVNRYTKYHIKIGDASIAEMTFTGTVLPGRVNEWVMNLSQAFPLKAIPRDDGTFELLREDKNLK